MREIRASIKTDDQMKKVVSLMAPGQAAPRSSTSGWKNRALRKQKDAA